MAKIVKILHSTAVDDDGMLRVLLIDEEGDGIDLHADELKDEFARRNLFMFASDAPGLISSWYKPEDVEKWKEHFKGYTTEVVM